MAPPTALAVDSATFYLAADRCFEAAEDLRDAFAVNVAQLADCGSMAGTYDSGRQWATSYDERSAEIFGAVNGVVAALHNYGDVLIGLGHTHELADHGAHLDPGAPPVPPPTPPLSPPAELSVPTCVGGPGEGLIDDALGLVDQIGVPVPDGDTDKLASARDVWDRLATVYQNVNTPVILQGATDLFVNETSPEIEYIDEDLGEMRSAIEDILHACGQMSASCEEYRAELEDLRLQLQGILDSLILEIAITATITIAAALVSFGTSALAGGTKAAESITRYARIIRDAVLGWRGIQHLQRGVRRERDLKRLRDAMQRIKELGRRDTGPAKPPTRHGTIDDAARPFSPAERRIADDLANEGRDVQAVPESNTYGQRTPDALVDGKPTEFKSLDPGAHNSSVKYALDSAKGQAENAIVDGRGSGLSFEEAQRGLARFLGANPDRMSHIRIIGDGWEIIYP